MIIQPAKHFSGFNELNSTYGSGDVYVLLVLYTVISYYTLLFCVAIIR